MLPPSLPIVVTFERRYDAALGWDDIDNVSPYINVSDPDDDIAGQRYPDELVIPATTIRIKYTYPLSVEAMFEYTSDNPRGFTRANLARVVCEGYQDIYDEEFPSAPMQLQPEVASRDDAPDDSSDGFVNACEARMARCTYTYGIRDHDIGDLALHTVTQVDGNLFRLGVNS